MCREKGSAKLCSESIGSIKVTHKVGVVSGHYRRPSHVLDKLLIPSVGEGFRFRFSGTRFALPTVRSCFLTIIMSSERPSKNKPMRKIARSLQGKLSSLLRLSRAPTPSLMDVDPRSDNDIATTNAAGTR